MDSNLKVNGNLTIEKLVDGVWVKVQEIKDQLVLRNLVSSIVTALRTNTDISSYKYHAWGTNGAGGATTSDTVMNTEVETRETGTQTNPASSGDNYYYYTEATHVFSGSFTITEWGLFTAAAVGTMGEHIVGISQAVNASDSLKSKFTLTVAAGG